MIVADPAMGRYQAVGHLFAAMHGAIHRLDRHPVMSVHPVTPMDEADLGRHLARQTNEAIGLVDFVSMKRGEGDARLAREIADGARIVSLDVLDRETLIEAGRLVWERGAETCCGIGSQGFEAALAAYWQAAGLLPASDAAITAKPVDRIACVSGSVSAVTAAQIAHARDHGFATIPLDATRAVDAAEWSREIGRASDAALGELGSGRDVLVYSAAGPGDPSVASFKTAISSTGASSDIVNERVGAGLGTILDRILVASGLTRVVISGGDTSGRAASQLGIDALTAIAPLAPGSPLCRAHTARTDRNGLEIALKGGQVGAPDFFIAAKCGGAR